jgi:hypothetical protein
MAGNVCVCSLDPDLEQQLTQFRFRKENNNCAVVMKVGHTDIVAAGINGSNYQVDKASQTIVCDEVLEDIEGVEELKESLPDHQPRFIVYTFKLSHSDGRCSYPMCFIFYSPR